MTEQYQEWLPHLDQITDDMFSWEAPSQPPGICATCKVQDAKYRCIECWDSAPRCAKCHSEAHRNLWFHWLEFWNGQYFERHDMISIHFVIYLGHDGQQCPNLAPNQKSTKLTIAHTNGIHRCKVQWCYCSDAPDQASQLIRARIWPATWKNIRTAFTVPLLRLYDHLWCISKVSEWDFMQLLQRLSDNAFPDDVTVCSLSSAHISYS